MVNYLSIFCCVVLSFLASPAAGQDTLTVMSYNIYHGEHFYKSGESNLEEIASVINRVSPDLVSLQEVDSLTGRSADLNDGVPVNQVKKLAEQTGMYGYFGKAMDFDGGGYGEGLLANTSLNVEKVALPIPKGGEPRTLIVAEYPIDKQQYIRFGGTHLCHQYQKNRVAQIEKINSYFSNGDSPAIIAGDFNFTPEQKPYHITVKKWVDAAKLAGNIKRTIPYDNPSSRIDYFFLSEQNWKIIEMKVLRENNSDHMPLVLKVVI
ncbi:endonuclease/exonuclease/phosphatase family protein [Fodinibius saliphilus]|uniref:endonuclease/exonuclease/phosphatase family protein n=1 Tax=Fodinibius saliphilus TaxID=1920650 RepID=UPI001109CC87|nr:endonuclease/exonuclease/phosphatase family protein [Fodinibius saliphilus]